MVSQELPRADVDAYLTAIRQQEARVILSYLESMATDRVTIDDLAEELDEIESGDPRIRLHHVILPTLANAGLLTYQPNRGIVTYGGHPTVTRLLHVVSQSTHQ